MAYVMLCNVVFLHEVYFVRALEYKAKDHHVRIRNNRSLMAVTTSQK